MIDQLKNDRIAQIMLVAVIIAAIFALVGVPTYAYYLANRPVALPGPTPEQGNSLDLLEFKDISADITDSFFKIQGSVVNNSQEVCTFVRVRVEYTDVDGAMIAFGDSYLASQSLSPDQSSPFRIITQRPTNSPKPDSFSLSLSTLTGCIPPD